MPTRNMNTRMIKEALRYKLELDHSLERTARALNISKGVVAKYVTLAKQAGLDWAQISTMTEAELRERLLSVKPNSSDASAQAGTACARYGSNDAAPPGGSIPASGPFAQPDYAQIHRELSRKGMTLMLLWQEHQANHIEERTHQYSQYCENYRRWAKTLKRSMRQIHKAGEKLFVDFAGPTLGLSDGSRVHLFVAAMGVSGYTYALATEAERTIDWIEGMSGALHYMGGVAQLIVPDNPRAVIAQSDRYEPRAGDSVLDFARHYGTSVLPARPHTPQDKAKAESAVQVIERWIMAKLRHTSFASVFEVNRAIAPLLKDLNARPFQKLPGSRLSVFTEMDAPALSSLPLQRYEMATFKTVRVHVDYHVEIDHHRYSVPNALVGQSLDARMTRGCVELLHRGQRIAAHERSSLAGGYTTLDVHMPAAHLAHRDWTPQRLIDWGLSIGVATGGLIQKLLEQFKHPEHGYRSSLGLLSLSKRYGKDRLEAACALALTLGTCKYRHVKDILVAGRDRVLPATADLWSSPAHDHVRGAGYYQ
jgi:transposase